VNVIRVVEVKRRRQENRKGVGERKSGDGGAGERLRRGGDGRGRGVGWRGGA